MSGYVRKSVVLELIKSGRHNLAEAQEQSLEAALECTESEEVIPVDYISKYQMKVRKLLKGRYFPDETIGWLLKDWRLDSERENK